MEFAAPLRPLIVLACFLLAGYTGFTQIGQGLQPAWAHLDKAFYLAGDPLGFQIYLAPEFAGEDILLQTILFRANGEPVLYNYWRQGEAHVHGQFQLPEDLPTSWYYLSFRAWDQDRKTERVLHQVPLAIYNEQATITPEEVSQREPSREAAAVTVPEKELQIELGTLPEDQRSAGEPLQLAIQVTNRRGRPVAATCSVSITDWELLSASLAMGMDNLQASDPLLVVTPSRLSSRFYWQGQLTDDEGSPLVQMPFTIRNATDEQELTTDERGRFVFQSQQSSVVELVVSLLGGDDAQLRFRPANGRLALGRLFYSPAAFRYLEVSRQRQAILETLAPRALPLVGPTNLVADLDWRFPLFGPPQPSANAWLSTSTTTPVSGPSSWFPNLSTSADGQLSINLEPHWEVRVYRIDIVAQDAAGQRGRTTVIYQMPGL